MDRSGDVSGLKAPQSPVSVHKTLPPDVLVKIFHHLPVPSLVNVALASRRFKVLCYDDEIWDTKIQLMLGCDSSGLAATSPDTSSSSSLMNIEETIKINNKPLNALIPGLSTDPFNTRARARSTGQAREKFKELYVRLMPYYVDLRTKSRESKVLRDYGHQPEKCGRLLHTLVAFGRCHVVDDWKNVSLIDKQDKDIISLTRLSVRLMKQWILSVSTLKTRRYTNLKQRTMRMISMI